MFAQRNVGAYQVTVLSDGIFEASTKVLRHGAGERATEQLVTSWPEPSFRVDVNCFLIRGRETVTLIDAGTGSAWGDKLGKAQAALEAAGVTPDSVDQVLLTHLHGDHALGLMHNGAAWLQRAKIFVPEHDYARYWNTSGTISLSPHAQPKTLALAAQLQELYGDRVSPLSMGAIADLPGIHAKALPGHTAGHTGYILDSAAEPLIIFGDAMHMPERQAIDPEAATIFDEDFDLAVATRRALMDEADHGNYLAIGSHTSGFGRFKSDGATWRWEQYD